MHNSLCRTLAEIGKRVGYEVQLEKHVGHMRAEGQAAPINDGAVGAAGGGYPPLAALHAAARDLYRLDVNFVVPIEGPIYDDEVPNQVVRLKRSCHKAMRFPVGMEVVIALNQLLVLVIFPLFSKSRRGPLALEGFPNLEGRL